MGGRPAHADPNSDWWMWVRDPANLASHRVSGDLPERGPGEYALYRRDIGLARRVLGANAFRLSIEWSRIFPRSTASVDARRGFTPRVLRRLDALADHRAVVHYGAELRAIRRAHMVPLVTVNHFTLPAWLDAGVPARDAFSRLAPSDALPSGFGPRGWLDAATVREFAKYAAYLGWRYRRLVRMWTPINEPVPMVVDGYFNGAGVGSNFPPGAFSYRALAPLLVNLLHANAAAYDALKATDPGARVGLVQSLVAFTPANPASARDLAGAAHADQLYNRLFLDGAVRGVIDADLNGRVDAGERHPALAGKADFVGVNYYFRGRVTGVGTALTPLVPLLDFVPTFTYRSPVAPGAPPCPTTCSDAGSEIYPQGLRAVLGVAGGYHRPVYITENGIADARDRLRPSYLVRHLAVLRRAMADHVANVRGYFHWSLIDNLEWTAGYRPKFGLFSFDPRTLRRTARPSARIFARVARANRIPTALARRYR
ncbi:MAG: glycoside hydrolase family 1 protein [Actinobacteria bacterium]|nr:MAG: glycoside hydrolase family 1 protein [Actinomycetota bacterium]